MAPMVRRAEAGRRANPGVCPSAQTPDTLQLVLGNWGQTSTTWSRGKADCNGDGFIGGADLQCVLSTWGQGTNPNPPGITEAPEPSREKQP